MKTFAECFAAYGAKLPDAQRPVSAIADDGAFMPSCRTLDSSRPDHDTLRRSDHRPRWASSEAGSKAQRDHLQLAPQADLPAADHAIGDGGRDASSTKKTLHTRPISRAISSISMATHSSSTSSAH